MAITISDVTESGITKNTKTRRTAVGVSISYDPVLGESAVIAYADLTIVTETDGNGKVTKTIANRVDVESKAVTGEQLRALQSYAAARADLSGLADGIAAAEWPELPKIQP